MSLSLFYLVFYTNVKKGTRVFSFRVDIGLQNPLTALRALSASASATNTKTDTQGFPKFNQLPPEIRRMIWELSFGPPRVFRTADNSFLKALLPMVVNHKPPPPMQACREARAIALEVGKFRFGVWGDKIKSLWFRKAVDIFYWTMESCPISKFHHSKEDGLSDGEDGESPLMHFTGDIENVAFDFRNDPPKSLCEIMDVACLFPGCKNLLVVLPHRQLGSQDIRFFYTKEKDYPQFEVPESMLSWDIAKDEILEQYKELDPEGKWGVPNLHAVEVSPIRKIHNGIRDKVRRVGLGQST